MFQAATMVAVFLIHLGILYSPCQAYHKLFHNPFDSARIITLLVFIATGVLFFQMCQMHSGHFWDGLLGWPLGSLNKSLPADLPSGRLPLLLVTWGSHHKSSPSVTLPLNQGESGQGRKQPEPGDVSKDGHYSPIQFLCLPSVVGIAPDSVCSTLSYYYNVLPGLSTHHPKLYPYWSSALTHQGSLAKIKLCMVGGCNLYTPHTSTLSDPTSNSAR